MIKFGIGFIAGASFLVACGGPETDSDAVTETQSDISVEDSSEQPVSASEADIVSIAKALAEYEALQEHCEYGSSQGIAMNFLNELAPTPSGMSHSERAIEAVGEAASTFVGAEPEGVCTPEMFGDFEGRVDHALLTWEKIKSGE